VLPRRIFASALVVIVVAFVGTAGTALAQADVSLEPAADDTLLLVGTGWRSGQRLSITLGHDNYPALADSTGGFEIRTGQPLTNAATATLSVHREDTATRALPLLRAAPTADAPHPFAVLFAQSLGMGAALFVYSAGSLGVVMLTARTIQSRRQTHR
jgi:hypothetical protein